MPDTSSPSPQPDDRPDVLSVSQLTAQIESLLEGTFADVWVAGEISNFSRPQSGHCYFTLKDESAQLRGVMWRSAAARLRFDLHDGLQVICRGALDVYPPRGSYQLVVEQMQPVGMGALELALRQLQTKLAAEGLFDPGRKQPLPRFPRRVAIVTSPTGAALRDFLEVLRRRWTGTDVLILPARVQGTGAAEEIAAAIALANRLPLPIDVLVVARGGGSLEDLWAFNEEVVVRAIFASRIPVVSAVGHEIDVTLSDLVADVRALTPSEAAERIAPAADALREQLSQAQRRLRQLVHARLAVAAQRLQSLENRRAMRAPYQRWQDLSQRLDELSLRLNWLARKRLQLAADDLQRHAAHLDSLSPLAVLRRGYSLTERAADGAAGQSSPLRNAADLVPGELLQTRFALGLAYSRVERIDTTTDPSTDETSVKLAAGNAASECASPDAVAGNAPAAAKLPGA